MRALVTGATSGLGAAFADALAERGSDLILVARDEARLERVAAHLRADHGVSVDVLRADLSVSDELAAVAATLESDEQPIELLVNNAGFGIHSKLCDPDPSAHRAALDVMCYAVLVLGGAAGRGMRRRGRGQIINVSSLASWISQGHYSAVKAWVRAYSEGLSNELHGSGVTVTAACPGWVRTEFHQRAGIRTSTIPDWVWVEPQPVVRRVLRDAERGKVISVPAGRWRAARTALQLMPAAGVRAIARALVKSRD
jgi:Short-chain dehydrogenases of various substrate specificities